MIEALREQLQAARESNTSAYSTRNHYRSAAINFNTAPITAFDCRNSP
jgi:hypothetical protein